MEADDTSGVRYEPEELPFHAFTGHLIIQAVVDAIRQRIDLTVDDVDAPYRRFVGYMSKAAQRLERARREAGENVERDAIRGALPFLEQAAGIRGEPEGIDELSAGRTDRVADHYVAASYVLDWALGGCRARLDELEEDGE